MSSLNFAGFIDNLEYSADKKLWLAELDYRTEYSETWNERGIAYDQVVSGASRNVAENDAQLRRDVGRMLTQGQGAWFFSLSGPGWSDPAYQKSIRESVHAAYMSAASPQSGDHGQMAVFHGEEDIHSWSGNGLFRLLTHQMSAFFLRDILNRSGLSYDSYLLSDLEHPERPDYPINIFVNCATLTSNQIRFIREKLQNTMQVLKRNMCGRVPMYTRRPIRDRLDKSSTSILMRTEARKQARGGWALIKDPVLLKNRSPIPDCRDMRLTSRRFFYR